MPKYVSNLVLIQAKDSNTIETLVDRYIYSNGAEHRPYKFDLHRLLEDMQDVEFKDRDYTLGVVNAIEFTNYVTLLHNSHTGVEVLPKETYDDILYTINCQLLDLKEKQPNIILPSKYVITVDDKPVFVITEEHARLDYNEYILALLYTFSNISTPAFNFKWVLMQGLLGARDFVDTLELLEANDTYIEQSLVTEQESRLGDYLAYEQAYTQEGEALLFNCLTKGYGLLDILTRLALDKDLDIVVMTGNHFNRQRWEFNAEDSVFVLNRTEPTYDEVITTLQVLGLDDDDEQQYYFNWSRYEVIDEEEENQLLE